MDGKTIKEWRETQGITRDELAQRCSVSYAAVANWELGRNAPHGAALEKLKALMSGEVAIIPLTPREALLLDKIVVEGGFRSRLDFLAQAVVKAISGDLVNEAKGIYETPSPPSPLALVAESEDEGKKDPTPASLHSPDATGASDTKAPHASADEGAA